MKRFAAALAAQLTIALALQIAATPCAAQLWGIQPASNLIVRVDPSTGSVLGGFVPPGGALAPDQLFGGLTIAEHGTTLLYQNPVTNPTDLFRIDPDTGALLSTEFMPPAGVLEFRAGLSFESGAGAGGADAIFAVNDGGPIQRQDGYGAFPLTDHFTNAIDFAGALGGDDNGRQFVAVLDFTTGPAIPVIAEFDPVNINALLNVFPSPAAVSNVGGMAFDGTWLYFSDLTGSLYTLNPDTGAVVNSVTVDGGPLIGLASRVPEPATLLLAALGGVIFWGATGRARNGS